jgi:hypothetical protein
MSRSETLFEEILPHIHLSRREEVYPKLRTLTERQLEFVRQVIENEFPGTPHLCDIFIMHSPDGIGSMLRLEYLDRNGNPRKLDTLLYKIENR